MIPGTALSRRRRDLAALEALFEDGFGFGDQVLFLLPDGWTEMTVDGETHWFDHRGYPRVRYHRIGTYEPTGPGDNQEGEMILQPLTRYFKRYDDETQTYQFVDRMTDQVVHAISTAPRAEFLMEDGYNASDFIGTLTATHRMTEWAAAEFPNWEDPTQYWE